MPAMTTPAYISLTFTPVGCAPDFEDEAVVTTVVAAVAEPEEEDEPVATVETTLAGAIFVVALAARALKALISIEGLAGLGMSESPNPLDRLRSYGLITPTMPALQCWAWAQ
jgi:hypothetical protein